MIKNDKKKRLPSKRGRKKEGNKRFTHSESSDGRRERERQRDHVEKRK